jgi:hypothetical protein
MRFLLLDMRPWSLLPALHSARLLLLLPVFLDCRGTLLLLLPAFLDCRSTLLLLLPAFLDCRSTLLVRSWTLRLNLPLVSHRSRILRSPLDGGGGPLSRILPDVLADYRVTRLVSVTPAAQRLLLLYLAGISFPRILTLVGGSRRTCRN